MGRVGDYALPELAGKTKEQLAGLLDRAAEVGLLTRLTPDAWPLTTTPSTRRCRGICASCSRTATDGTSESAGHVIDRRSRAARAWVEAMGELSNYYTDQFVDGNRGVIQPLALEEANLLHARRAARRHGWWGRVTSAMQGLRVLYEYQGRTAEWARLVAEIAADYCTPDDGPIPGREDGYSLVMGYRVDLARDYDRDLPAAARLQEKRRRLEPPAGRPCARPAPRRGPGRGAAQPHPHAGGQRLHPGPNPDGAGQPRLRGGV